MAPNIPATTAEATMTIANGTWTSNFAAAAPERLAATNAPMPRNAT